MQNNSKTIGKPVVLLGPVGCQVGPVGSCRKKENDREDQKTEKQAAAIGTKPAATNRPLHLPINRVAIAAVTVAPIM
tara:strand:- start:435 stop:665 length:231 start_codon:yes stop_codon:yes gene_type:complete